MPVHSRVASQKRKAGIYFKKWKWFGRRKHIPSLVPSLCLENRSGSWGGDGRRAWGRGKAYDIMLMIVPGLERSSQGQAHSAKIKGEKRVGSL